MDAEPFKQLVSDCKLIFGSAEGLRVLDHLHSLYAARTSVVPGDSYATHFNEGQRSVLLYLHRLIALGKNPKALATLLDKPPTQELFDA